MQATWLSKLHDAQEKYQETVKSRNREAGGSSAEAAAAGATSHGGTVGVAVGPTPEQIAAAHGSANLGTASGRSWLDAAGTSSSLIVPSFAVHDYGELVRADRTL